MRAYCFMEQFSLRQMKIQKNSINNILKLVVVGNGNESPDLFNNYLERLCALLGNGLTYSNMTSYLESFLSEYILYSIKQHLSRYTRKYIKLNCNLYQIL